MASLKKKAARTKLERLRKHIRQERISYKGISDLEDLAGYIEPGDVELLQWAMTEDEARDKGLI